MPTFLQEWRKLTVVYVVKRNNSCELQATCKLGRVVAFARFDLRILLCFVIKSWVENPGEVLEKSSAKDNWIQSLQLYMITPLAQSDFLPMFLQLNDILFTHQIVKWVEPTPTSKNESLGRRTEIFKLPTAGTERVRGEFTLRTCRLINNLHEFMVFDDNGPQGEN